jgi:hypothetical protein
MGPLSGNHPVGSPQMVVSNYLLSTIKRSSRFLRTFGLVDSRRPATPSQSVGAYTTVGSRPKEDGPEGLVPSRESIGITVFGFTVG